VTVIAQSAPAARVVPHVLVCWKSLLCGPESVMLAMFRAVEVVFFRIMALGEPEWSREPLKTKLFWADKKGAASNNNIPSRSREKTHDLPHSA
jgi:hypothetical protein